MAKRLPNARNTEKLDGYALDGVKPRVPYEVDEGVNSGMLRRLDRTDGSPIPSHDGKSPGYVPRKKW